MKETTIYLREKRCYTTQISFQQKKERKIEKKKKRKKERNISDLSMREILIKMLKVEIYFSGI